MAKNYVPEPYSFVQGWLPREAAIKCSYNSNILGLFQPIWMELYAYLTQDGGFQVSKRPPPIFLYFIFLYFIFLYFLFLYINVKVCNNVGCAPDRKTLETTADVREGWFLTFYYFCSGLSGAGNSVLPRGHRMCRWVLTGKIFFSLQRFPRSFLFFRERLAVLTVLNVVTPTTAI